MNTNEMEEALEQEQCADNDIVNDETIPLLMQTLKYEFNLTNREIREYTQTLKYILEG